MKSIFLILILLFGSTSYAQLSKSDKNKVLRILADDFNELPPEKSYFKFFECDGCKLDTSLVFLDKFDGSIYQNEFVLYHNSISFKKNAEVLKLMRNSFVTVEEYQEFENWVRDSIARTKLAEGIGLNYDFEEFGNFEKIENYHGGFINGRLMSLNWNKRFSYDDLKLMPTLANMYLPQPQRFYRQRIFDKRKYFYTYIERYDLLKEMSYDSIQSYFTNDYRLPSDLENIEYWVPIIRNEFQLAKGSEFIRDEQSTLLHFRDSEFAHYPVNGLRGFQAEAYCHWKAEQLQAVLDRKGLKYEVRVTLPVKKDVVELAKNTVVQVPIEARDYALQWKITNAEYLEFIEYVKDSVRREYLYLEFRSHEDAIELLDHPKVFLDEWGMEVKYVDETKDKELLRDHFNLNMKYKINWKNEEVKQIMRAIPENDLFHFIYFDMNFEKGIIEGRVMKRYDPKSIQLISEDYREDYPMIRKHSDYYTNYITLGDCNPLGKVGVTRSHESIQRLIEYHRLDIRPTNYSEIPSNDSLITTISYEQALAFYHWKYPIQKINEKSDWQDFVLPTKVQYDEYLLSGEYVMDAHTLEYEGPFFRYAVHFFPKN